MSSPTNSLPKYSQTSDQRIILPSSMHYPHAASTYGMAQGTSQAMKNARSRTNSLSTKSERTSNSATVGTPTPLIPSIGLRIKQQFLHSRNQVRTFVIKPSHDWLPIGVLEHKYGAPNATCPKCIQPETVRRHLYLCHSRTNWRNQFIEKLTKNLKDASTIADLRCTNIEGIQKSFRTDDTNEPDKPDPTTQLGLYQVIKGYLPIQWTVTYSSATKESTQVTIQANNGRETSLHSSGHKDIPSGKIGAHPHTALLLTASTSQAPALDRHNKSS
jgi:hypothetical protein